MNEDKMQERKEFFKEHLKLDEKWFVDAVCSHNVSLVFEFLKLAYAAGVKDGIIDAYSKELSP